jgi:SSS family solute:Na+ symporter
MKRGCLIALMAVAVAHAGESPQELRAYLGGTPVLDGVISPGEWSDATEIKGTKGWAAQFSPTTDASDLSLHGWVKHDQERLWFAFDVTDDVLYGIDIPRWLPEKNPLAHELTQQGWPWFGDEMEILINATDKWQGDEVAAGDGTSWQMVCNLTKSHLHGVGIGGLMEGEPRVKDSVWQTYRTWIDSGAMQAVTKPKKEGKGYIIEWSIAFNPCLEVAPGTYYRASDQATRMGLNIAIGDLDDKEKGAGNFGNFHHEDWWAGHKNSRTQIKDWGSLILLPDKRPQ